MVIVRDGKEEINEILLKNENICYKVEKYFKDDFIYQVNFDYIFYDVFYLVSMILYQNKVLRLYKFVDFLIQVI